MATHIQLDMFAVRLGASVLLQFNNGSRTVRVLADAGYAKYGVAGKLDLMRDFGDRQMHIDLIIGTHYDGDHLAGLVEVIEREDITIGEAWMPPVADDTRSRTNRARSTDMLAHLFRGDEGAAQLQRYLSEKRDVIEQQQAKQKNILSSYRDTTERPMRFQKEAWASSRVQPQEAQSTGEPLAEKDYFVGTLERVNALLGKPHATHADVDHAVERPMSEERYADGGPHYDLLDEKRGYYFSRPERAEVALLNLASIERSAAQDAITASHLKKVVDALDAKGVPIRCEVIDPGIPRRFVWSSEDRRFIPNEQGRTQGPTLQLMGPSSYLVEKYWRRLPLGDYMYKALRYVLPHETITPANELSYIMRFEHKGQGVLITGDAGCVDFKENEDGDYYPALLEKLLPVQVIQVAHHAGHNAYFYHSLLEAGFAEQKERSLLLISHGVDDKSRPSSVFDRFIAEVRKDGDDVQLLFTSRPLPEKVVNFKALIHKPVGTEGAEGDIRLVYDGSWKVRSHAIKA